MKEMVGGCCVCSDERGWPDNPLVYCDGNGCSVAVHQACYGIVTVPTGPWYCRKCESPETKGKVRCELCPSKSGALKRTDTAGWAHVVCALYIPEVRFGNVTSMEPIVLRLIPPERYNKTCYICHDSGKTHRATAGACMQCNKSGCKQQFHVTCAQSLGLLCEEAGNYLDNVKYCGYCQHHYSKLKKGGNVKTIPPYKPVSHDSHSSDSSGEKEGDASPKATGSGTPTHASKSKGPGRKSSHSSSVASAKNTPNSSKTPTNTNQPIETNPETEKADTPAPVAGRKHKSSDKNKKKPSPSRRGSSTDAGSKASTPAPSPQHVTETQTYKGARFSSFMEAGNKSSTSASSPQDATDTQVIKGGKANTASSPQDATDSQAGKGSRVGPFTDVGSKASTPAPSPQDATDAQAAKAPGSSTPSSSSKVTLPAASPSGKLVEPVGVISSVPSALPVSTVTTTVPTSTSATTTVLQAPPTPKPASYPESVITNTQSTETDTKQTKKRKAMSAANTPTPTPVDYAVTPPPPAPTEVTTPPGINLWDSIPAPTDAPIENVDKIVKKAKTESSESQSAVTMHFSGVSPAPPPPPPPPAHSPASQPSPRHLPSPMPGPSGVNTMTSIRSPSQPQVSTPSDLSSPHIFHQPQKQAAMEPGMPGHSPHSMGRSPWGGLNVAYEMQQDLNKLCVSAVPGTSKDACVATSMIPMPPAIRNKKRAAMATSMGMATPPLPSPIQTNSTQSLANVRRPPQPTPPPIYQETIKDSPPNSPGTERASKAKLEKMGRSCSAPHMLGNELNPESGAAARLQEQLSAELAAHAAGSVGADPLVPPPLLNKAAPIMGPSSSSVRGPSGAQSLDQLLERQWEQGSQFLMEQAQHFDIASLLSCLHQLRTENVRLEDHVGSLLQRRDHLLAVNARLAIPLTTAVSAGPSETSRCTRENGSQVRAPPAPVRPAETVTSDRSHQLMIREVQQKPS